MRRRHRRTPAKAIKCGEGGLYAAQAGLRRTNTVVCLAKMNSVDREYNFVPLEMVSAYLVRCPSFVYPHQALAKPFRPPGERTTNLWLLLLGATLMHTHQ